jgi:glycerol kinase
MGDGKMENYILGIDQSTTATKAIIFGKNATVLGRVDIPHKQYYPNPGWVEHDPAEIYTNVLDAIRQVLQKANITPDAIAALAVTNQRETTVVWDSKGNCVYNAIVWQCARAEEIVQRPEISDNKDYITKTTGLMLSPYFSAGKARWLKDHSQSAEKPLFFGTMDSWVVFKLTGNHVTDYSNASRTQLFNIHTLQWDEKLLSIFGLEDLRMPAVKNSDEIFGHTTAGGIFKKPIPVAGIMGDSHGALFAQQCWHKGMGKCSFGTGGSIMMNIGYEPILSKNKIGTSIAWGLSGGEPRATRSAGGSGKVQYVFEGTIICMGDTIKWLVDEMGLITGSAQSQEYAEKVNSTEGVYLVPAFNGMGAPHWKPNARAVICGIHRHINKYHIVRAGVESIAYQVRDIVDPMLKDSGTDLAELRVDGGPTNNTFLMDFTSTILRTNVLVNSVEELSSLGTVYAAGLAIGFWKDLDEIKELFKSSRVHTPVLPESESSKLYAGWVEAVQLLK